MPEFKNYNKTKIIIIPSILVSVCQQSEIKVSKIVNLQNHNVKVTLWCHYRAQWGEQALNHCYFLVIYSQI